MNQVPWLWELHRYALAVWGRPWSATSPNQDIIDRQVYGQPSHGKGRKVIRVKGHLGRGLASDECKAGLLPRTHQECNGQESDGSRSGDNHQPCLLPRLGPDRAHRAHSAAILSAASSSFIFSAAIFSFIRATETLVLSPVSSIARSRWATFLHADQECFSSVTVRSSSSEMAM